jgi:hypothetical protein
MKVELLRCPHGTEALSIGDVRVTPIKHCGRWNVVKTYEINPIETIRVIEDAMEDEDRRAVEE